MYRSGCNHTKKVELEGSVGKETTNVKKISQSPSFTTPSYSSFTH